MCLASLHRQGYQVFKKGKFGRLYPLYCGEEYRKNCKRKTVPVGKWETDKSNRTLSSEDEYDYPSGFHIFLSLTAARARILTSSRVIRRVEFKEVLASGLQARNLCDAHVIVAKRRLIHKEDIT